MVAPYVCAWIETKFVGGMAEWNEVAPYVGAWIETTWLKHPPQFWMCRTLRGCVD